MDIECVPCNAMLIIKKKTVVAVILTSLLLFDALAGPLRYYLSLISLEIMIYLPKVGCLLFVIAQISCGRINNKLLAFLTLLIVFVLVGLFYYATFLSVLFAIFLISPMLFGITAAKYIRVNESVFVSIVFYVLIVTVIGVYLDFYLDFPWKGFNYTIGYAEIEGSREWKTFGIDRLAGFTRQSAAAAFYLVCTGLYLCNYLKNRLVDFVVWSLAFTAILLTTNKAGIVAFMLATFSFALIRLSRIRVVYVYSLILLLIVVPFSTLFIKYKIDLSNPVSLMLFASFDDRLINTWPNFISGVSESGNYILGAGFGGSGSSIKFINASETSALNFADNFALYLYGWFGFISVFILLYFGRITLYLFKSSHRFSSSFAPVMIALLVASLTTDIIESQILALFLGISIGLVRLPKQKIYKSIITQPN